MNKNSNWQISRSRWMPTFLKNFMPEFLDFIVSLVEANKPFIKLVQTRQRLKTEFYLYVPEVGGSSILLVSDLKKSFPESVIYILSDQLSEQRQDHFTQLNPELNRQAKFIKLGTMGLKPLDTQRILIAVNHAHLLSDQQFGEELKMLTSLFDQILIGEGNNKSVRQVIGMLLLSPLVALVCSPRVKPFRFSRLIFTYLIPVFPLMISWDGIVALFKIRAPEKIVAIAKNVVSEEWTWTSGKSANNRGGFVIYLHGSKKSIDEAGRGLRP
ncbi:MAG: hypothetical protein JNL11_09495 [Bdellovibrionaceae bacterium]|nr:hypothetical protein [Pseudobdellovibrionaceae bacterium]